MTRRVVVTGIGLATPIGNDLDTVAAALKTGRHGIVKVPEWGRVTGIETRLAGEVPPIDFTGRWPRQATRSMGRVAKLSAFATDAAIADAAIAPELLASRRTGLAYGSTHGSSHELESFCREVFGDNDLSKIGSSAYLRFMSHTTTANLAALYGIRGRVLSTCAACVSASQAIGAGFESIKLGRSDLMITGGAEELHWVPVGVFDLLYATSRKYNDAPDRSPRPFDVDRDGLVVAEGAGTLVLESLDHAVARGARIYAEVLSYGTSCDGSHVTAPSASGMAAAMSFALEEAGLAPSDIDYVNAHATGTRIGDTAESFATRDVLGAKVPISSTKGFTGHTLGACGAIELAFCIAMMEDHFLAPSKNLESLDPECAALDYVRELRDVGPRRAMNNNFAFGGINTSLVIGAIE
jgi:3-oxoacyl-[acyl-carrier-protein] synthase II